MKSTLKSLTIVLLLCTAFIFWGWRETYSYNRTMEIESSQYEVRTMKVTAFCPCEKCCGKFADGITASGHKIVQGDKFVAAPPEIPFGTMIEIPNYGLVPVLDRGGVIKGDRLDVFFDTHEEALEWGVKYLECKIRSKL